ncbi:hypothetical protein B9Z55_007741 [Caenorhabditis nigoni]|uniref:F-box domain-containing protein n=1 Tax=Caenorhabditis nigoni TaxID=1611254 RepID=A0A2G5VB30_9PELO|nr:hypothetical protein B9Z55_007741 [Caenorhabditis nigoni]
MASNIENLAEKADKSSTESIYDRNWCDMPADIKLECIGKMELKERLSLRCTAKAERSLVDSKKMHLIECTFGEYWIGFSSKNEHFFAEKFKDQEAWLNLMQYILKFGVFDKIIFRRGVEELVNTCFLGYFSQLIPAKNIEIGPFNMTTVINILQKFKDDAESISLNSLIQTETLDAILQYSHIKNASYCQIKSLGRSEDIQKIAQMWIDEDSKIGTTFQITCDRNYSFELFPTHFADRIVSQTEKRIRIRTNNPAKHILVELEHQSEEVVVVILVCRFYRLMVISADMKESEYDDDNEERMRKMAPEWFDWGYDSDGEYED